MKPIRIFSVIPALPAPIEGLRKIAYNLRWAGATTASSCSAGSTATCGNRAATTRCCCWGPSSRKSWRRPRATTRFWRTCDAFSANLRAYLTGESSWFRRNCGNRRPSVDGVLFGGVRDHGVSLDFRRRLGILAGDHLKSASDLGVPLVGVGLLYQQGYFGQYLNAGGLAAGSLPGQRFSQPAVSPGCGANGQPVVIEVGYPGGPVRAQVWRAQVGRVALYLLDTNFERTAARRTAKSPTSSTAAIGKCASGRRSCWASAAIARCEALGLKPTVCHMNEGHSAFLALEHCGG